MVADSFPNASRAVRLLSGLFFLLLCEVSSLVRAELLAVKTYTTADGMLRDEVYRVKQDSRGFLWFCTADGLSRFDGYGFANYPTQLEQINRA